jgi:hypothetical protein
MQHLDEVLRLEQLELERSLSAEGDKMRKALKEIRDQERVGGLITGNTARLCMEATIQSFHVLVELRLNLRESFAAKYPLLASESSLEVVLAQVNEQIDILPIIMEGNLKNLLEQLGGDTRKYVDGQVEKASLMLRERASKGIERINLLHSTGFAKLTIPAAEMVIHNSPGANVTSVSVRGNSYSPIIINQDSAHKEMRDSVGQLTEHVAKDELLALSRADLMVLLKAIEELGGKPKDQSTWVKVQAFAELIEKLMKRSEGAWLIWEKYSPAILDFFRNYQLM